MSAVVVWLVLVAPAIAYAAAMVAAAVVRAALTPPADAWRAQLSRHLSAAEIPTAVRVIARPYDWQKETT